MRPSWKSLADFLFTRSPQVADLSYLVLFTISAFLAASHSCHFSQIAGIFCCWVESSLPPASTFFVFLIFGSLRYSSFVHERLLYTFWSLTAWLGAWDLVFLFNRWDLILGCVVRLDSGIFWDPSPISPGFFFFWLIDFGRLGLPFFLCVFLKPFPFMGLWILILWAFLSSFSSFFFFYFFIIG